jgi:hypothetical protein
MLVLLYSQHSPYLTDVCKLRQAEAFSLLVFLPKSEAKGLSTSPSVNRKAKQLSGAL